MTSVKKGLETWLQRLTAIVFTSWVVIFMIFSAGLGETRSLLASVGRLRDDGAGVPRGRRRRPRTGHLASAARPGNSAGQCVALALMPAPGRVICPVKRRPTSVDQPASGSVRLPFRVTRRDDATSRQKRQAARASVQLVGAGTASDQSRDVRHDPA